MSRRYGNPYSVILLEIDHFKNYNDTMGHVMGDDAIRAIARLLISTVRTSDSVYRYGGEEFLVVMPETGLEGVAYVSERIRADTESVAISHPNSGVLDVLTVSLGHASVTRHNIDRFDTWRKVVEDADRALYRAKQGGRNGVVGSNRAD